MYEVLNIVGATPVSALPRDVFTSNESLVKALKIGAYFRSDLKLNVSISGTISHAGTLLVGILPPMPASIPNDALNVYLINSIMSGPHCFLHANEATSAVLHVPWYCNSDVDSLDLLPPITQAFVAMPISNLPGNFGTLVAMVLNPLAPSDGASGELKLIVEACLTNLDIFVPSPRYLAWSQGASHTYESQGLASIATTAIDSTTSYVKEFVGDAIDMARAGIKFYTGLHNPNVPLINNRMIVTNRNFPNNTTGDQFFEKLDPYPEIDRIVDRPIFNSSVDEMSIKHILSKPQYVGTFKVLSTDQVGQRLWCRPISPNQGGLDPNSYHIANNIELFHYLSRAWRGSIKIHVQSVMNNKQQVKLRLLQLYNPSEDIMTGYPQYATMLSAPSHLMEFSGGGQVQTVELPYLCRNQLTPCAQDLNFEALFHGEYYIFVAQPLVVSSDSPLQANFNVFISVGDDFSYHGYSTNPAYIDPFIQTLGSIDESPEGEEDLIKFEEEQKGDLYTSQGITVMNEPQLHTDLSSYSTDINLDPPHQERLYSPIDIRPIIRRMYQTQTIPLRKGANVFDLNTLLGETNDPSVLRTPMQLAAAMYYGKSAGLKLKLKVYRDAGAAGSEVAVMYIPPQFNADTLNDTFRASFPLTDQAYNPHELINSGYALPFIEMPAQIGLLGNTLYEFVVPNTNFYKFVGGPDKFTNNDKRLSTAAVGQILIWSTENTKATIYAGCTDESRFGFHSIAPSIRPATNINPEGVEVNAGIFAGGAGGTYAEPCPVKLNPYIYYSRQ
jgi:hypothetical protein